MKGTNIDGDLSIGRNVAMGGSLTAQGGAHIKGSVKIAGWLDAKNIKAANKGLFATEEKLIEAYPEPLAGWWAVVGPTLPGEIYMVENRRWVASGKSSGNILIDDEQFREELEEVKNNLDAEVERAKDADAALQCRITGTDELSNPSTDPFKLLISVNDVNDKNDNGDNKIADALDGLHSTNVLDNYAGVWRIKVFGAVYEVHNIATYFADDIWIQMLFAPLIPLYNDSSKISGWKFTDDKNFKILIRTHSGEGWTKFEDLTENNIRDYVSNAINSVRTIFSVHDWEPGYYIRHETGEVLEASKQSAVTDFIDLKGAQSIEVCGRAEGGIIATVAFYDENKKFRESIASTEEITQVSNIPENAKYVRATGKNDGNDKLVGYADLEYVIKRITEIENQLTDVKKNTYDSTAFDTAGYYINSNNGSAMVAKSESCVTDYIEINNAQSLEARGRKDGGMVATVAFYDAGKVFMTAVASTEAILKISDIPEGAKYVRATGRNDGLDYVTLEKDKGLNAVVKSLQKEVDSMRFTSNILLTGASFAYSGNQWPELLSKRLGVACYNKAVSGSSILDTARKMYEGTLYSDEEMEDFDIFMVMHVHNQDVFVEDALKANYKDYENETFFPSGSVQMSYSQAYDYVLKKYTADCYAKRENANSQWYNQPIGKPVRIVCLTHWHDARTIFNDSVRLLKDKWGFELVELDKEIGFTKEQLHPETNIQVSRLYAQDEETIGGVVYGWHPSRDEINGESPVIQQRIAKIVADGLTNPTSVGGSVELKNRVERLSIALSEETARAQAAEQALQGNIDALESTLQDVEATLGAEIGAEEKRAKATELELREEIVRIRAELISAISAEAERAQAAEQKLQQYIDEAVSPYITFGDAEVERICLANFDYDADGELSKEDAAAVTDLGTVFRNNTVIESFNELRQFKRVKALGSLAFSGCSQLESIDLSNVEIFNSDSFNGSFKDCASLTNIGSLSKVKSLDNQGFYGCTSLENIGTLDNLETIGRYCFRNTAIKSVIAPKLQDAANPSDSVHGYFADCAQLETVYIPMMKVIYSTMFDNCSNLKEIVFSNELTEIKSGGLNTNSDFITKIELPATCVSLGYQCLANNRNLETLIVRATTPPTLGDQAFYYQKPNSMWGIIENLTIYVPNASVDAYKSATNWVTYVDRIKPLSEYVEQ